MRTKAEGLYQLPQAKILNNVCSGSEPDLDAEPQSGPLFTSKDGQRISHRQALRRFFTLWHEIAHLLTLTHKLEPPFHRSADVPCPLERLMDIIAGEIAFYDPIFVPQLVAEIQRSGTARLKTSA